MTRETKTTGDKRCDDPWDDVAADWDRDDGPRLYAAAAYESLLTELRERSMRLDGLRVLDFGAGTGLLTERLVAEAGPVFAVDSSAGMLERLAIKAAGWPRVTVADRLPSDRLEVDLVVCSSVLGFVDHYRATVEELVRHLAPGGLFVQWDWERTVADDSDHGLTRAEIADALAGAGLVEIGVRTGFSVDVDQTEMRPLMGSGVQA